jgi:hypothetical protein
MIDANNCNAYRPEIVNPHLTLLDLLEGRFDMMSIQPVPFPFACAQLMSCCPECCALSGSHRPGGVLFILNAHGCAASFPVCLSFSIWGMFWWWVLDDGLQGVEDTLSMLLSSSKTERGERKPQKINRQLNVPLSR